MGNKTRADAFDRVSGARTGSLVDPTQEYLDSLRQFALDWVRSIENEINLKAIRDYGVR